MMLKLLPKVIATGLSLAFCAQAAEPGRTPADTGQSSLYAVNAAALASAMTYCETRHGGLQRGSAGAACFSEARNVLAAHGLMQRSEEVAARCNDPATFNTCLTPEIARLVRALNTEFKRKGL